MTAPRWSAPPPIFISGIVVGLAEEAIILHFVAEHPVVTGDDPPQFTVERPRVASVCLTRRTAGQLSAELVEAMAKLQSQRDEET